MFSAITHRGAVEFDIAVDALNGAGVRATTFCRPPV